MSDGDMTLQEREWGELYDRISALLQQFGRVNPLRKGDYWLVNENWGIHQHKLEIQNLRLIGTDVIKSLQKILGKFPDWEIIVAVDIPGKEELWPSMGLTIRQEEIVDGLQRQYLPDAYQQIVYDTARPASMWD